MIHAYSFTLLPRLPPASQCGLLLLKWPILVCWSLCASHKNLNHCYVQVGPKMAQFFSYALTSSNTNRFSKLFHCQNQEKTCNNITKDPTTPQVCRYTTLWNVKCLKSNNEQQGTTCLLSQLSSKVTVISCRSSAGILHGCLQQDGAPSHTTRNTPTYLRRRNVTFIEHHMWSRNSQDLNPVDCAAWSALQQMVYQRRRFTTINQLKQSLSGANCWNVSSIAPLVSGVTGLSGSSRSKANKLNIWCKNCSMWVTLDKNWDNKHAVPCW